MSTRKTRKKHSPEEVVRKLQQADKLLAEDKTVPEVCRCWRLALGGSGLPDDLAGEPFGHVHDV